MNEVRLGVIGCGGMARNHMRLYPEVPRLRFAAASDIFAPNLQAVVNEYGVKGFDSAEAMMESGEIDAVFIATPHYFHPRFSIAAMRRNLHVLTEKPVAVTAKAAAEVNAVHQKHKHLVYGAMFQMRAMPRWQKVKELLTSGELGEIYRVHWTATKWFRSQTYYNSGSWRATWAGEGGGVLMNQCPHNLDMFVWLTGVPSRVTSLVRLGRYHEIEVEDEVTSLLEYPSGASGVFICSTGEAPGTDRLEILGDRGRLIVDVASPNTIEFYQTAQSVREYGRTTQSRMGEPESQRRLIESGQVHGHRAITENFVEAILDGTPLFANGEEGLDSVELANAMLMSGLLNRPIDIPTDREAFDRLLQELIEKSKVKV